MSDELVAVIMSVCVSGENLWLQHDGRVAKPMMANSDFPAGFLARVDIVFPLLFLPALPARAT